MMWSTPCSTAFFTFCLLSYDIALEDESEEVLEECTVEELLEESIEEPPWELLADSLKVTLEATGSDSTTALLVCFTSDALSDNSDLESESLLVLRDDLYDELDSVTVELPDRLVVELRRRYGQFIVSESKY